jgi:hypothetical protein
MVPKLAFVYPLARRADRRHAAFTTLLMSTGLTFGTIASLDGLTAGIIDETQFSLLVTVVVLPRSRRRQSPSAASYRWPSGSAESTAGSRTYEARSTSSSGFRVLLGRPRVELEAHERLVADHPRVVTGLDLVRVARADVLLGPVLVDDVHRSCLSDTDVVHLAPLSTYDRLDALRPGPSGLEREASGGRAPHPDDVDPGLRGRPGLVG